MAFGLLKKIPVPHLGGGRSSRESRNRSSGRHHGGPGGGFATSAAASVVAATIAAARKKQQHQQKQRRGAYDYSHIDPDIPFDEMSESQELALHNHQILSSQELNSRFNQVKSDDFDGASSTRPYDEIMYDDPSLAELTLSSESGTITTSRGGSSQYQRGQTRDMNEGRQEAISTTTRGRRVFYSEESIGNGYEVDDDVVDPVVETSSEISFSNTTTSSGSSLTMPSIYEAKEQEDQEEDGDDGEEEDDDDDEEEVLDEVNDSLSVSSTSHVTSTREEVAVSNSKQKATTTAAATTTKPTTYTTPPRVYKLQSDETETTTTPTTSKSTPSTSSSSSSRSSYHHQQYVANGGVARKLEYSNKKPASSPPKKTNTSTTTTAANNKDDSSSSSSLPPPSTPTRQYQKLYVRGSGGTKQLLGRYNNNRPSSPASKETIQQPKFAVEGNEAASSTTITSNTTPAPSSSPFREQRLQQRITSTASARSSTPTSQVMQYYQERYEYFEMMNENIELSRQYSRASEASTIPDSSEMTSPGSETHLPKLIRWIDDVDGRSDVSSGPVKNIIHFIDLQEPIDDIDLDISGLEEILDGCDDDENNSLDDDDEGYDYDDDAIDDDQDKNEQVSEKEVAVARTSSEDEGELSDTTPTFGRHEVKPPTPPRPSSSSLLVTTNLPVPQLNSTIRVDTSQKKNEQSEQPLPSILKNRHRYAGDSFMVEDTSCYSQAESLPIGITTEDDAAKLSPVQFEDSYDGDLDNDTLEDNIVVIGPPTAAGAAGTTINVDKVDEGEDGDDEDDGSGTFATWLSGSRANTTYDDDTTFASEYQRYNRGGRWFCAWDGPIGNDDYSYDGTAKDRNGGRRGRPSRNRMEGEPPMAEDVLDTILEITDTTQGVLQVAREMFAEQFPQTIKGIREKVEQQRQRFAASSNDSDDVKAAGVTKV